MPNQFCPKYVNLLLLLLVSLQVLQTLYSNSVFFYARSTNGNVRRMTCNRCNCPILLTYKNQTLINWSAKVRTEKPLWKSCNNSKPHLHLLSNTSGGEQDIRAPLEESEHQGPSHQSLSDKTLFSCLELCSPSINKKDLFLSIAF